MKPPHLPPIVMIIVAIAIPITLNTAYPMTRQDLIGTGAAVLLAFIAFTALTR